jgi:ABC-2 type transport system ATP-binding protein
MPPVETPRSSDPLLVIDGVHKHFGDVVALEDLNLAVTPGEVVGLLGHNGAGKTTTVRLLAGLLAPEQGTVRVGGGDPVTEGPAVRGRMGVLPAALVVDARLTARQNLRFAADVFGVTAEGLETRIDATLALFELADRADDKVGGFSSGMRQRLSLARVLLPDPDVLLLDEPTSALDPVAARQVRRTLAQLAQDRRRTIVLCTHDLAEAELLCDRVVVLERGRVVADGNPVELAEAHGTGGVQLEVAAEDVTRAAQLLASVSEGEIDRDGNGRLRTHGLPREAIPPLVARLAAEGLTVYEVRRLDPSLEDVYLALHAAGRIAVEGQRAPGRARAVSP